VEDNLLNSYTEQAERMEYKYIQIYSRQTQWWKKTWETKQQIEV